MALRSRDLRMASMESPGFEEALPMDGKPPDPKNNVGAFKPMDAASLGASKPLDATSSKPLNVDYSEPLGDLKPSKPLDAFKPLGNSKPLEVASFIGASKPMDTDVGPFAASNLMSSVIEDSIASSP
ncbi:hypothetical protein AMTR_s00060p00106030 [Amborella trichopoda]|uniref:Uncharacterized protein n=1 Tax=Amborella trichopoda TaxID=13333 RepID=W1NJ96_AMBTC|nr:hypothetical protein AMTR_s00060p00106030 [Amborella trichopoda]